jgi:hypothetical protein
MKNPCSHNEWKEKIENGEKDNGYLDNDCVNSGHFGD